MSDVSCALIFGTELRYDHASNPFTTYQVLVRQGLNQWVILRYHEQFDELHAKCKNALLPTKLKLPKRKLLFRSVSSPAVLARAQSKLQRYLMALLAQPILQQSPFVKEFLSAGKQPFNDYAHLVQPFIDAVCPLVEMQADEKERRLPQALDMAMQSVADGELIDLDVRHTGRLSIYHKGKWHNRLFQWKGTNCLFEFTSMKKTMLYDLSGYRLHSIESHHPWIHFKLEWREEQQCQNKGQSTILLFRTLSERDLEAWLSHLNHFAMARSEALIRKELTRIFSKGSGRTIVIPLRARSRLSGGVQQQMVRHSSWSSIGPCTQEQRMTKSDGVPVRRKCGETKALWHSNDQLEFNPAERGQELETRKRDPNLLMDEHLALRYRSLSEASIGKRKVSRSKEQKEIASSGGGGCTEKVSKDIHKVIRYRDSAHRRRQCVQHFQDSEPIHSLEENSSPSPIRSRSATTVCYSALVESRLAQERNMFHQLV